MTMSIVGKMSASLARQENAHRAYDLRWLVVSNDADDGPERAFNTPGLPTPGSTWVFGNDNDPWAFCSPEQKVTPVVKDEKNFYWYVDQKFSTRPLSRCQSSTIENPINEPPEISGSFVKYIKEVTEDKDGNPMRNSSHEMIRGKQVEFDHNRPTVKIAINSLTLGLSTFAAMVDTVNDATLWGLPTRCIKLSNVSWQRKLYGTCTYYYTRALDFDVNYDTFDREVPDEGTMVLSDGGDVNDPRDFEKYKDVNGENTRVFLNGSGQPWDGTGPVITRDIKYYQESNFLSLGIPTSF